MTYQNVTSESMPSISVDEDNILWNCEPVGNYGNDVGITVDNMVNYNVEISVNNSRKHN